MFTNKTPFKWEIINKYNLTSKFNHFKDFCVNIFFWSLVSILLWKQAGLTSSALMRLTVAWRVEVCESMVTYMITNHANWTTLWWISYISKIYSVSIFSNSHNAWCIFDKIVNEHHTVLKLSYTSWNLTHCIFYIFLILISESLQTNNTTQQHYQAACSNHSLLYSYFLMTVQHNLMLCLFLTHVWCSLFRLSWVHILYLYLSFYWTV